MKLAIEFDNDSPRYGYVHAAGCKDLRDGEVIGDANTRAEANALAYAFTGWDEDEQGFTFSPCAGDHLH